ncbi:MAG TPA: MraY family glycosyltransferase [Tepidisphaeraceae bacterium]|nr:MraY family glycosyltransferase [Tepidisphaeraceae bacterium]
MIVPILILAAVSFCISWGLTFAMIRIAPRVGLIDRPGTRKIHQDPKPLAGGIAIFLAIASPFITALALVNVTSPESPLLRGLLPTKEIWILDGAALPGLTTKPLSVPDDDVAAALWSGAQHQTPLAMGVVGAMFAMHVLGLLDDRRALGPFVKLLAHAAIAFLLVISFDLRALTAVGYVLSVILTVLWIVAVTNSFNFLDNMDGLSAGVAAVCATAFLITALTIGQWFVAAALALLLGAVLGFLCFNFPPASIFMGDSGSLVIGFLLGVLTVRTTFLPPGTEWGAGWYAVFAPVIVLAVPMYDMIVVILLRLSRRKSPFIGDTNHFSHRLVARGMSRRTAVLCIYLVTAATSMAAILLPHVNSTFGAMLIFAQTLLVLGVVALLEQHPLPPVPERGISGEVQAQRDPPPVPSPAGRRLR